MNKDSSIYVPGSSDVSACDVGSTPYEVALEKILREIKPLEEFEELHLRTALNRVSVNDITAKVDVPISRNSAMDGYACRFTDLSSNGDESRLSVVGTASAGNPCFGQFKDKECIRIFTGGVVPEPFDTVIMQEDCEAENGVVLIHGKHRLGQFVRAAGEDVSSGEVALMQGQSMNAAELGVAASVGARKVRVRRNPRVAFFSTGDELKSVGSQLHPGDIYDSNRYTLYGLLREMQLDPVDLGTVKDNLDKTIATMEMAAGLADVVVTTAGASVGDADFVITALETLGELKLWKVAMKPGRPLAFGKIGDTWFFGLPGNPVSVMVTFDKFVKPALYKLQGRRIPKPLRIQAICSHTISKQAGRLEFQRGVLSMDDQGQYQVESTGNQSSGALSSMSRANCYIVLPSESSGHAADSLVTVEPFSTNI